MSKPRRPRVRAPQVSEVMWAHLTDAPLPDGPDTWETFACDYFRWSGELASPGVEDYWREYGAAIVEDWIEERRPGTRPSCWWEFDAPRWQGHRRVPEPRLQVGGSGVSRRQLGPVHDFDPYHNLRYGLPRWWATNPTSCYPPHFESEAAYLDRHGLLLPGERERLTEADFAPVEVRCERG